MASTALAGFVYGDEKDRDLRLKLRHHIDMRPYDTLPGVNPGLGWCVQAGSLHLF